MKFFRSFRRPRPARQKPASCRLTIETLESRDLPSNYTLGPLVQVSGASPFAGSTADNPAGQAGTFAPNSEGEPYLAVNPTNTKNFVAAWQHQVSTRWKTSHRPVGPSAPCSIPASARGYDPPPPASRPWWVTCVKPRL